MKKVTTKISLLKNFSDDPLEKRSSIRPLFRMLVGFDTSVGAIEMGNAIVRSREIFA
jgi:hypothetical protein